MINVIRTSPVTLVIHNSNLRCLGHVNVNVMVSGQALYKRVNRTTTEAMSKENLQGLSHQQYEKFWPGLRGCSD